jgi:hypothetical protein
MDEDQLNDLKQFITATVSQATAGMATKGDLMATKDNLGNGLTILRTDMNQRFDEIQSSISDIIATNNDAIDEQLTDHEQRLAKLEHQTV